MSSTFHIRSSAAETYRFDLFEVRVGESALLRDGRRVKIQELPFRMLLVLLEHAGQTVSREELLHRLWGDTHYADLENNLYQVALKLREALREDAAHPRFVETVPKQGYRFSGELLAVPPVESDPALHAVAESSFAAITNSATHRSPVEEPRTNRRPGLVMVAGIAAFALGAVASLSIYIYVHRPLASSQDRIAVGEFINSTANPDFDRMLSPALRVKLQESPYLSLLRDQTFRPQLAKTSNPRNQDDEIRACIASGAQILLRGKIQSSASGYEVSLTAWRCSNGRQLTTQTAPATSLLSILPALDTATMAMRRRLGEPDGSLAKFNVPITQATTGSFPALKAYSQGYEKQIRGLESDAVADFKLAVDLDPQFALAYTSLGVIYYNASQLSLSRQYLQNAFSLRGRTTDYERLVITSIYYSCGTGEIQRAIQAYELWRSIYPGEVTPANNIAGLYIALGQPEKAVEPAMAAIRLDPALDAPYATLVQAYLGSGDYPDAKALCDNPARRKTSVLQFHEFCYVLGFVLDDAVAMQRELDWGHGQPLEGLLIENAAFIAVSQGKLGEARQLFSDAKQNAMKNGLVELAALIILDEATFEADLGFAARSKQLTREALSLSPNSLSVQASAALALARSGDVEPAEMQAKKASDQAPLDTLINSAALASVRAAIQLQRHDPKAAIQALEVSRPFDFNMSSALAPAYYRGLAYLENNDPQSASKEFQRVLDHRTIMPHSPYVVLSQFQLGRSLQLAGDTVGAARAYQAAANNWKDADQDFPSLHLLHTYEMEMVSHHPSS